MSLALADRVALVTGASRGIGAAIAERFAAEGAYVLVTARSATPGEGALPGSLAETVARIEDAGGRALALPADLADPADRARLVDAATAAAGPVDALVNNAAVTWFDPITEIGERRIAVMLEVQLLAAVDLSRRLLPAMRERRRGHILNISSLAARHPVGPPYSGRSAATVYGMVKAALERFTTGLAAEVYADGIAVNCLAPEKVVRTPGVELHGLTNFPTEPVERMAGAALVLCSGDPATATGQVVTTAEF